MQVQVLVEALDDDDDVGGDLEVQVPLKVLVRVEAEDGWCLPLIQDQKENGEVTLNRCLGKMRLEEQLNRSVMFHRDQWESV